VNRNQPSSESGDPPTAVQIPTPAGDAITFADLFSLAEIQRIQDEFALATGVASMITHPDGTPITAPSNFTRLCSLIRQTERGGRNCQQSDAVVGRCHPEGPMVQRCLSGGLWDAGASITAGGRHVANWLIGQVRDEAQTEEPMRAHAHEIGAEEAAFLEAFRAAPTMTRQRFEQIARLLFTLARHLSATAYQNFQQARQITERQQAETALRESEEKFSRLFHSNPMATSLSTKREGRYLDVNAEFLSLLQRSREEVVGHTSFDLNLWVDPQNRAAITTRLEEQGAVRDYEFEARTKSGEIRQVLWSGETVSLGGEDCLVGSMQDITERRRAERALRESEERFARLFHANPMAMTLSTKREGRFVDVNARFLNLLQRSREEVIGRTSFELKLWLDPRERAAGVSRLEAHATVDDLEFAMRTKSGEIRQTSWSGTLVVIGGEECLLGVVQDITERKQAEAALRASQERYALAERAVNDGLWDWNLLTDEEYFSPRFKEIMGCRDDELPSQKSSFLKLVHPDDLARVQQVTREHLDQGQRYELEYRLQPKDGICRWVFSRGEAVRDAAGRPIRMVGSITDITERKQMETKMQRVSQWLLKTQQLSQVGGWTFNLKTGEVWVSPEACRIYGVREDAPLTIPQIQSFPLAQYRPMLDQALHELVAGHRPYDVEFQIARRNDGAMVDIRSAAEYDREQAVVLGVIRDITEDKRTQTALRDSEERYRRIFTVETDAILLVDRQTQQLIDANPAAEQMFGYSHGEFLRLKTTDLSAEPEETKANIASRPALVPRRLLRRKNGTVFPAEISASDFDWQNRCIRMAAMRDITERQRAEEVVRATEQALRTISACHRALVLAADEPGLVQQVCQIIVEQGGYRMAWIGLAEDDGQQTFRIAAQAGFEAGYLEQARISWSETDERGRGPSGTAVRTGRIIVVNDFQNDPITAPWRTEAAQRGYAASVTLPLKHAGQSFGMLMIYAARINAFQDEEIQLLSELADDLANGIHNLRIRAERELAYAALRQSQEQMRLQLGALTAAANAIVITDCGGKIEWVNPAFTQLTGYAAEEAIGSYLSMLKSGQHPPAFYANLWATITLGNPWHGELINRRKDGRFYTEEMTITPVRDAEGRITHYVAVKQDVTERRQLETQSRQAQKMEAIGALAGGIAHDFNNILAIMFGSCYLLQLDTQGNAPVQESIRDLLQAAERARDLVQQILTFSRQREHKREVIRLEAIIKEATKFLRASLPAQIKIELNLAADAPAVLADATQIYQVVINLATNALHAMEGGCGRLTVNLDSILPGEAIRRMHPELQAVPYARLTVADTGHGMDAKTLERIFEPFFTTKPVGKGTGLGLAVVHGIVRSHEGVITVESQPGQGTTFRLYFPAQTQETAPVPAASAQLPPGQGQKILLVDDEPVLTTIFQQALQRLNYQVTTSNSPRAALGWFREQPGRFDLVLTDLTMPEMSGLEVARRIHELRPELPIVLVSGHGEALTEAEQQQAGVSSLLDKPVSLPRLAELLHQLLG
jgi:PAS domain S-box-containing protein